MWICCNVERSAIPSPSVDEGPVFTAGTRLQCVDLRRVPQHEPPNFPPQRVRILHHFQGSGDVDVSRARGIEPMWWPTLPQDLSPQSAAIQSPRW